MVNKNILSNFLIISIFIVITLLDSNIFLHNIKPLSTILIPGIIVSNIYLKSYKNIIGILIGMIILFVMLSTDYNINNISLLTIFAGTAFSVLFTLSFVVTVKIIRKIDGQYAPLKSWRNSLYMIILFTFFAFFRSSMFYFMCNTFNQSFNTIYNIYAILLTFLADTSGSISMFLLLCSLYRPINTFRKIPTVERITNVLAAFFISTSLLIVTVLKIDIPSSIFLFLFLFMILLIWTSTRAAQRCTYFVLLITVFTTQIYLHHQYSIFYKSINQNIVEILSLSIFVTILTYIIAILFTFSHKIRKKEKLYKRQVKKRYVDLRKAKEELEYISLSKSSFLASISHELRTPLNSIIGAASILKNKFRYRDESTTKQLIKVLNKSSEKMLTLTNNLLDLSRLEFSAISFDNNSIDVRKVMKHTIKKFEKEHKDSKRSIKLAMHDDVPDLLIGDEKRIAQIISSILNSSSKVSGDGHINLSMDYKNECLEFLIQDSCPGSTYFHLENIFRPFNQIDPYLNRETFGINTGITIAARLIELMNGKFEIDSSFDNGIQSKITLPLMSTSNDKHQVNNQYSKNVIKEKRIKILIVDENDEHRMALKAILSNYNIEVTESPNGIKSVEQFKSDKFDLIMIELQMVVLNGYLTIQQIRKYEDKNLLDYTPTVALTKDIPKDDITKAFKSGFDNIISRPINSRVIIKTISKILGVEIKK